METGFEPPLEYPKKKILFIEVSVIASVLVVVGLVLFKIYFGDYVWGDVRTSDITEKSGAIDTAQSNIDPNTFVIVPSAPPKTGTTTKAALKNLATKKASTGVSASTTLPKGTVVMTLDTGEEVPVEISTGQVSSDLNTKKAGIMGLDEQIQFSNISDKTSGVQQLQQ